MKYLKLSPIITKKEKERVIFEANKILGHKFEVLSKEISFNERIDWHTNFAGKSWPKEPYDEFRSKHYDFFNPEMYIGDIKLPWEFNKHLHFQELAKAYLVTEDEKYANEFFLEIDSWLRENPFRVGVNWIEGLIASHRIISWVIALEVFEKSPFYKEYQKKIHQSLEEHAQFIEDTYEFGEKSGNHLLGELCAQIVLSEYLGDAKSKKRLDFAVKQLVKELEKQIYPDGVDYEQSISYERVILEFLYLPLLLEKAGKIKLPKPIWKTTEKMTEFMLAMTQPGGYLQPISDADGARIFILGNDVNDFRPHLAVAAYLFKRGDFKLPATSIDAASWFIDNEKFLALQSILPKIQSQAFPDGGYFISRSGWKDTNSWLFFDCGRIGMGKNPENAQVGAHGHSDTLTFGINIAGVPFITDIGSYSYSTEKEYHDYFRSSLGHNTPRVNGEDQNILANYPWSLYQLASGENQEWQITEDYDYFLGEHPGYHRLEKPVNLRREILHLKSKKIIIIKDSLIGEGRHFLEENFHLYPGVRIDKKKEGIILSSGGKKLIIQAIDSEFGIFESWYAPTYGKKERAKIIGLEKLVESGEPLHFIFNYSGKEFREDAGELLEEIASKVRKRRRLELKTLHFELPENYFAAISRKFLGNRKIIKKLFDKISSFYDGYRRWKLLYKKAITFEPDEIVASNLTELLIGYLIKRKRKVKLTYKK